MPKYVGVSCPYCNRKFVEDDDIVVCPECGAPHHRECWLQEQKCHFSVLHNNNFEWKMPFEEEEKKEQVKTVACKYCGTENPENAISCSKCKAPINIVTNDSSAQSGPQNKGGFNQEDLFRSFMDPLGGVPKNEEIDGVTAEELGNFIGDRAPYFVRMFYLFKKRNSSVSFNFFACIFNGYWFLSKKMYKIGALLCALTLAIFSARTVADYFLLSNLGTEYTVADFMNEANLIPAMISSLLSMVQFVIMIICGMFANSLYMKHCTKTIKSIDDTQTKSAVFAKKGGTNLVIAISLYACYMVLSTFGYNIIETVLKLFG